MEKVFVGSDHGGFELKNGLVAYLKGKGYYVVDVGPATYDKDDDYPDYVKKVCRNVIPKNAKGILICKYSHGVTIAANKMRGIYASTCWNEESARMARNDGNTNVLCLSGMMTGLSDAQRIADCWLSTPFSDEERHRRRIQKVKDIENSAD